MFLKWQFKILAFLLKLFGLMNFEYPSKIFKRSKFGILMFLINSILLFYLFHRTTFGRKYDFVKKLSVVLCVSIILSISMFVTKMITLILFFVFGKNIFELFKLIENFDITLKSIGIKIESESIFPSVFFMIRFLLTIYVFGRKPISVISLIASYSPVDLYFHIVISLIKRLSEVEYFIM